MKTEGSKSISKEVLQAVRREVHSEALREAIAERNAVQAEIAQLYTRSLRNTAITVVNFLEPTFPGVPIRLEGARFRLTSIQTTVNLLLDAANIIYEDFGDKSGIMFRMEGTLANGKRIHMERDYDRIKTGGIRGALYTYRLENTAGSMRKMTRDERIRYGPLKFVTQDLARETSIRLKENTF